MGESEDRAISRRDRQRQVTLDEITSSAQRQLTEHGVRGFSLRAVAREVGLTPSAIYRYYDSQTALVSAVALTAYEQATDALRTAADLTAGQHTRGRLEAVFTAYRAWALTHPGEFELLFATDQSLLRADEPAPSDPANLHRLYQVPLEVLADGIGRGEVACAPEAATGPQALTRPAAAVRREVAERTGHEVGEEPCLAMVSAWVSVHGYVALDLYGHLGAFLVDRKACFRRHLGAVLDTLGV
ncbi:TetR/AcrR family transcriptional regulator [Nocardioides ferulae]|uniref:TetR/AcrR family transcriptional regulator n=1 Tax=Nocardioides ferulae TaxID=2340821 RepID=UPI0013DE6C49|nr:TetR/AcrR family transcriptional regulator [Nocardioides ferulae]